MKVIRSYSHVPKAHLDRSLLEAHDIPVELRDELTSQLDLGSKYASGGVKLAVPEQHMEEALDLLGRETDESRKRVEEIDRQLKQSIGRFALKVLIVALVILVAKDFQTRMIFPALFVSLVLNGVVIFLLNLGKK